MNILSITVPPLYAESIQQLADLEPFISSIITYQFKITNFTFVKIKNCDLKIKGFIWFAMSVSNEQADILNFGESPHSDVNSSSKMQTLFM